MFLLDTDHISMLHRDGDEGKRLQSRLATVAPKEIAVTIISYEEPMRVWLAEIARLKSVDRQMIGYSRLERLLGFYCASPILRFDDASIAQFQTLWLSRPRIGTMDLKVAAIALANNATLLTRNQSDFSKIPSLRTEDWSA